jgi:hypothetical protein
MTWLWLSTMLLNFFYSETVVGMPILLLIETLGIEFGADLTSFF